MAIDVTLGVVGSLQNETEALATINLNSANIESAFFEAYSRWGTPNNQMSATMDMNNQQIINLPAPSTMTSPVRLADIATNPTVTVPTVGTSGATVPLMNGSNTWTGSDNFTGATVNVATQTAGNNTTLAASTAFVANAVASNLPTSIAGLSVLGNTGTTTAAPAAITGTANKFLGVNSAGTSLSFETMSGDATLASGALTLATVNTTPGVIGTSTAIPQITTNGKGLVTAQTTVPVIAPAGTLTGGVLASNVVSSSLNSVDSFLELGTDSATPAASFLASESVVSGTNNQAAGVDLTISGPAGTGTGIGGSIVFATSPVGASGTSQNTPVEANRILPIGRVKFTNAANFTPNGTVATTMTSLGPTGASATVQEWLTIQNASGVTRYIPCY
jgi:hypothetical protein